MKGENTFSVTEIDAIKRLIAEKVNANPDKQKIIRQKIRKLGFYYSDFESNRDGYTVADFEAIIRSGRIKIKGSSVKHLSLISDPQPIKPPLAVSTFKPNEVSSLDITTILNQFLLNRFDPLKDDEKIIADSSGCYLLCLRANSALPGLSVKPSYNTFDGLNVLYTGIASKSLKCRDYRQHFNGNAGKSTVRKSLGVLFGYKQIARDADPTTGKTKFGRVDEDRLTTWMHSNLIMFFFPTQKYFDIELGLISHFNPPLNLQNNHNAINKDFRRLISNLRSVKSS